MIQTTTPIKTNSGYTGYIYCDIENEEAVRNLFNYGFNEENKDNRLQIEIRIMRSRKYEGDVAKNYYKITVCFCEYRKDYTHTEYLKHINYEEEIAIPPKEYITMRKMLDFMENFKTFGIEDVVEKFNKSQSIAVKVKVN